MTPECHRQSVSVVFLYNLPPSSLSDSSWSIPVSSQASIRMGIFLSIVFLEERTLRHMHSFLIRE